MLVIKLIALLWIEQVKWVVVGRCFWMYSCRKVGFMSLVFIQVCTFRSPVLNLIGKILLLVTTDADKQICRLNCCADINNLQREWSWILLLFCIYFTLPPAGQWFNYALKYHSFYCVIGTIIYGWDNHSSQIIYFNNPNIGLMAIKCVINIIFHIEFV